MFLKHSRLSCLLCLQKYSQQKNLLCLARLNDLLQWIRKLGKHNIANFPACCVFDLNLGSKSQSLAQAKKAHQDF